MKVLSSLFALCACSFASAQIVIDENDMPSAGDTVRYWTGTPAGFDGADTGPAHVWDFSQLVPIQEGADTCVAVGSTPLLYQLFFNNPFLYPDHDADYAVKGTDFGFQQLTVENVYDYFKNNGSGFRNVGFGATINSLPSSIQRDPVDWIHHFPLQFGDVDSAFSSWALDVPTLIYYGQDQWRHNEVDGWGTLYLPADTFEVLRVKSTLMRTDTIYIDQFSFGFTLPEPETIEYKWLASGEDGPVLQVNTALGAPVLTRFRYDLNISTTVEDAVGPAAPAVYPNPASDLVFVRLPANSRGDLRLLDATGRELRRVHVISSSAVAEMDVTGLGTGLYTLLLSDSSTWSGKLAIDRR